MSLVGKFAALVAALSKGRSQDGGRYMFGELFKPRKDPGGEPLQIIITNDLDKDLKYQPRPRKKPKKIKAKKEVPKKKDLKKELEEIRKKIKDFEDLVK